MRTIDELVREQLESRRQLSLQTAEKQRHAAYSLTPSLYEVDSKMARTAMEIATAAMSEDGVRRVEEIRKELMALQAEKSELLAQIGMTTDDLLPPYHCNLCNDTGFIEGKRCVCYNELYSAEAGKQLPRRATDGEYSFDSFRLSFYPERDENGENCRATMRRIAEICAEYAEKIGSNAGNLLFMGKTGLGKTHLSLAIAARAAERGKLVLYSSAQGVLDRFERTRFNRSPSAEDWEFASGATRCDLLVIDDLGSEFNNSFSQSVLYNIINDRMMEGRETVVSTNLDAAKLTADYEQRISSRLLCGYTALGFCGKDIRLQKRMRA